MDLLLSGKTAVVTGASQGIGRAIAKCLAMEGVKVLATARNEGLLSSLKAEVAANGGLVPETFVQDLMESDGPGNIAAAAFSRFDHVDILVNNAGRSCPVKIMNDEDAWVRSMTLDFDRPRQLTQQLLPHFINRRQGSILNLVSSFELRSMNVSSIAKSALTVWSKQLATEVGRFGLRVNCLQPGLIDTENIRPYFAGDQRRSFAEREIPLGDFGEPEDMANMAVFLVSPRAKYITGIVVGVDGGMRHASF